MYVHFFFHHFWQHKKEARTQEQLSRRFLELARNYSRRFAIVKTLSRGFFFAALRFYAFPSVKQNCIRLSKGQIIRQSFTIRYRWNNNEKQYIRIYTCSMYKNNVCYFLMIAEKEKESINESRNHGMLFREICTTKVAIFLGTRS